MNIYIGTGLANHAIHNKLRDALVAKGHTITYDWTEHGAGWMHGRNWMIEVATKEAEGVREADMVVIILPGGRGTHSELGIAIGAGKPVVLIPEVQEPVSMLPETCAFYWHPRVDILPTEVTKDMWDVPMILDSIVKFIEMESYDRKLLAEARYFRTQPVADTCHIRCMGMQAANQQRLITDNSISYDEDAFNVEADQIENMVRNL